MKSLFRPRLITFDVTGTLLKTKLELYAEIAVRHGLTIDRSKLAPSFKSNFKKLTTEHPIYGKHSGLGWENWWRTIVYNVYRDQHPDISNHKLEKMATSLIQSYGTSECWQTYPGTTKLLRELKKRDVALGVISNFDERLESILRSTDIRSYFSFVLTSYELGVEKPNPLIFRKALEMLGETVLPCEAIHVGDNLNFDYFGAKNVGWNAVLVKHDNDWTDERIEGKLDGKNVVGNLDELTSYLITLLGGNGTSGT